MRIAKIIFGWCLTGVIVYIVMVVGLGMDRVGWLVPILVLASAIWLLNRFEVDRDIAREHRAEKVATAASPASSLDRPAQPQLRD